MALTTLIPLLVLVAAFESVFALHVNVERIGRYLQVFHERAHAGWEHVTMDYARRHPGGGSDPLFRRVFIFATSVNFFPAALGGESWEVAIVAACHFAFIYRVRKAQSLAASIRAEDPAFRDAGRDRTRRREDGTFYPSRTSNPLTNAARRPQTIQSVGVVIQRSIADAAPSQTPRRHGERARLSPGEIAGRNRDARRHAPRVSFS